MAKKSHTEIQDFDRSTLKDKMRVFQLAKALGVASKDVVVALTELGITKVAQSSITREEAEKVIDALQQPADKAEAKKSKDSSDEKIRERVRKDVENEIHQIEEKVDATFEAADEPEQEPEQEPTPEPEPESAQEPEPEPEEEAAVEYAPIFKAPTRPKRRRAVRTSEPKEADEDAAPKVEVEEPKEEEPKVEVIDEPKGISGSARLEAQRRRRSERREAERQRSRIVSEAEFLARRESVHRTMVVRERDRNDGPGRITQVAVLEDGLLAEHFVSTDDNASIIGNIYMGRVQNVLPGMEAAFIDIGTGRNAVLYASEVDWKAAKLGGKKRRIEHALKSGDQVMVQVSKDINGHKGARLTTHISLAGRFLVYVPGGRNAGISRKLPVTERKRLKGILNEVVPGKGGAIIRTAAEGMSKEAIAEDVQRLHKQWEMVQEKAEAAKNGKGSRPVLLYEEPRLIVRVVRDVFNEDFSELIIDGKKSYNIAHAYLQSVAPDLLDRVTKFDRSEHDGADAFAEHRIDEQVQKALARVVWLPSGGTLVIERTEAMTVIDVNTGKFTGSGGNLEETVTANNLEAAEEVVRQLRLRDIGGMVVIDFIDMILDENKELVLRRLKETLGRDRSRHQVSEVTSLGLVQLTRKKLGDGLLETYSKPCECCGGRGVIITEEPVAHATYNPEEDDLQHRGGRGKRRGKSNGERSNKKAEEKRRSKLDEKAIDELVGSVVSEDNEAHEDNDEPKPPVVGESSKRESGSRRRGRRGTGRGRGRAQEQDKPQDKPQEQAQEKGKPEQTYEEAVDAFERSPRRKRATRGNSRSDHKPKREDFERQEHVKEPAKEAPREEAQEQPKVKVTESPRRRGRRRAVRKTSQPQQQEQPKAKETKQKATKPATKKQESKASARRRRRRATRRTSSK